MCMKAGSRLDIGCWMLVSRFSFLVSRYSMLDDRYSIASKNSELRRYRASSIQNRVSKLDEYGWLVT
jgi:hypothetical protein